MRIRTVSDVAALIRVRRSRLKWDQAELALKVGVSRKWVVEIEGGKTNAALGLILRTLRVLGVELDAREDEAPAKPEKASASVDVNALVDSLRKKR